MKDYLRNIIPVSSTLKEALERLNSLGDKDILVLFVLNDKDQLVGTLTDGDIRRGLLEGKNINSLIESLMFREYRYLLRNTFSFQDFVTLRDNEITLVPLLDLDKKIVRIIDLSKKKSVLPFDAVIMAGGKGERLKPLTNLIPKPLLMVGEKPILEHNIDRLIDFGIDNFFVSINYLGSKITDYFGDGKSKGITVTYVEEEEALGTIAALGLINEFNHNNILVMNSDLLTNINFEDFFINYLEEDADMIVASIPYKVDIPYAVMEVKNNRILSFKEKPTYTYYSNAGIYLMKKEIIDFIPKDTFFNATDLMELLIEKKKKVVYYPIHGYWLDIGRHEDYHKAQEDIKHLTL